MDKIENPHAPGDLLALCIEIWSDYHSGRLDYNAPNLERYTRKHAVGKFPKNLIAPILLKQTAPTDSDVADLRSKINRYVYSRRGSGKDEALPSKADEQAAIALLKRRGYRVMKKTITYITV